MVTIMAASKLKQVEFDVVKWLDSEAKGVDTCGSYEFCKYCKMDRVNPCERAAKILGAVNKRKATIAAKKASM